MIKDDESAVAYGIVIIALFLFSWGILFILVSHPINEVIDGFNTLTSMTEMSEETTEVAEFYVKLWPSLPLIALFGVFAWRIVRAIETKENGKD
ncbi:MAG: hypothetical protein ACXQTM_01750 [Methanosarcinales archaeon]|nr:MAG: hypothetical protein DRN70_03980 [Methanosarcinales archaeon]